jgi:hypothetical protein
MKIFQKIILIPICLLLVLQPGAISVQSKQAQATSPQSIHWMKFANELEDYLWAYRKPTGVCNRMPYYGACLSASKINSVMDYLTDPNSDGNFNDMYFKISIPNNRLNFLKNTKKYPVVLNDEVLSFERYKIWPSIYVSNMDKKKIYSTTDSLLQLLKSGFPFYSSEKISEGTSLIKTLAFEKVDETDGVPILALKSKSKISSNSLDKIYSTPIMSSYSANRNFSEWQSGEIALLNTVNQNQQVLFAFLKKAPTATKAKNMAAYLQSGLADSEIPGTAQRGGIAIFKASKPASGYSLTIGSQTINLTDELYLRIFQFSSTPSMVVRYQKALQNIDAGAQMIAKSHRDKVSNIDIILLDMIKNNIYVASSEYIRSICGESTLTNVSPAGCYNSENKIFYLDINLISKDGNPVSLVVHEMFHYLRFATAPDAEFGWVDEIYTDWMTDKTLKRNGNAHFGYGYNSRRFFYEIKKRLAAQQDLSPQQQDKCLENLFFNSSYSTLDTLLDKSNFSNTLKDLLQQLGDSYQNYQFAVANNDRAGRAQYAYQYYIKNNEIINYILN